MPDLLERIALEQESPAIGFSAEAQGDLLERMAREPIAQKRKETPAQQEQQIQDILDIASADEIKPSVVHGNLDSARTYRAKQVKTRNLFDAKRFPVGMAYQPDLSRPPTEAVREIPFRPLKTLAEIGKAVPRFMEQQVAGTFGGTLYDWFGQFIEQGGIALDKFSKWGAKNPDQIYNPVAQSIITAGRGISTEGKKGRKFWLEQGATGWEALDEELQKNDPISYGAGRLTEGVASSALSVLAVYLSGGAAAPITLAEKGIRINRGLAVLSAMSAAGGFEHAQAQKENFAWSTFHGLADGGIEYVMESNFLEGIGKGASALTAGFKEGAEEFATGMLQNTRAGILENEKKGMTTYEGAKDAVLKALKQSPWEVAAGFIGGWGVQGTANLVTLTQRANARPIVSAEKPPQVTTPTEVTAEIGEPGIALGVQTVPPSGETVAEEGVRPAEGQEPAGLTKGLNLQEIIPEKDPFGGYSYGGTLNKLPSVPEGHVRVYRTEHKGTTKMSEADKKRFGEGDFGRGGWFTTDLEYAMAFYEEYKGKGTKLYYLDLTKEQAERYFLRETKYRQPLGEFEDVIPLEFSPEAEEYLIPELREAIPPVPAGLPAPAEKLTEAPSALSEKITPISEPKTQAEKQKVAEQALVKGKKGKEAIEGQQILFGKEKKTRGGFLDIGKVMDIVKTPGRMILSIGEPAKLTASPHGKDAVAAVMQGTFGKAEARTLDYNEQQLESMDMTYNQLEQELNRYPKNIREQVMLTRGHGLTGEAKQLQKNAFSNLPQELKDSKVRRAIDEIADFNYEYLSSVFGEEVETLFGPDVENQPNYIRDYFYGIYKDPKKITAFLNFWKTTDRFLKHKVFPTYADAKAYGLEIKDPNPITNLKAEYEAIARRASMAWLKDELMRLGNGVYIMPADQAPMTWDVIGDGGRIEPTFSDVRVEPEMARLINHLISTNKITRNPILNTIRKITNFLRSVRFIGSAFHMIQIAKQSVYDQPYLDLPKLAKEQGWRGVTFGFNKNDPLFNTPEYRQYIENGGGHRYAVEWQARKAFIDVLQRLTKSEQQIVKALATPIRVPVAFVDWMFESYIPKVKYAKYLDRVAEMEAETGHPINRVESQEVIKEIQNFYGMMNERLFGRSGTMTTLLRFVFIAPGYAEGNYRTMIKAASQWGQGEEGFRAKRSRSNIINSILGTTALATIGTLIFTRRLPKKPETLEELRDLMKIDTGKTDEHGSRIMIDLATYEKDYWNVGFNVLRGRPDIAIGESIKRIGGMKAPTLQLASDLVLMMQGKALYDWKDDKVYHVTDPLLQKILALTVYETEQLSPISVSVFSNAQRRGVDRTIAAMEALLGLRPDRSERDRQEFEIVKSLWDMRDKREKLSMRLNSYDDPWRAVEIYNKTLEQLADNKFLTDELRIKIDELKIDPDKVITWKRFPPERMTTEQLVMALEENTYVRSYRREDGTIAQFGDPHKGYEIQVTRLKDEFKKRTGKEYQQGMKE